MKRTMLGFAAAAIAACAFVGGALADTGKTVAQVVGAVQTDPADPTVAYVTARYSCQPGAADSTAAAHLFVSVKQSAERSADPALTTEGGGFGHLNDAWTQSDQTNHPVCGVMAH